MNNKIRVAELFAGVGGFRLGLEGWNKKSSSSSYEKSFSSPYEIVWSNQWEPATKMQHASIIYKKHWSNSSHSNENILTVNVDSIPEHDLLVGGFPCQDYSVATTLKNSKGLIGKKGILWWSIYKILDEKKVPPKFLLLENVDRLLISPSKQRGRDFAIILQSLNELGYIVEWRIINAADYGFPQRRRRTFIVAYHRSSHIFKVIKNGRAGNWIFKSGTLASAFPLVDNDVLFPKEFMLDSNLVEISKKFNINSNVKLFENSGLMINGLVTTFKTMPKYQGHFTKLGDILQNGEVTDDFFIDKGDLKKWEYLKGSKKEERETKDGFKYHYSEGGMIFPDALDNASRTIITGEGGKSPSRFKHVVNSDRGLRRLTPVELERLNMFPDNHTQLDGITDTKRAFLMGNALVIGVIEKIGIALKDKIKDDFAI